MSKRKKRQSRPSEYERLEGPGFTLERSGRFVLLNVNRTPEEQLTLNAERQKEFRALPGKIKEQAQRLEQIFKVFNSFDLLAMFSLTNLLIDPDTYVESEQKGSSFVVEYATLLLLKDQYRAGEEPISPEAFSEATALLSATQADLVSLIANRSADPNEVGPPSELEELQFATELYELGVRNPAYEHHLKGVLEKLFLPFAEEFVGLIGFSCGDSLRIISAIGTITSRKLSERVVEACRGRDELERAVQRSRRGLQPPPPLSDLVSFLASLSKEDLFRQLSSHAFAFIYAVAGDTISFTVAEIVSETSLAEFRVRAFLSSFSLTFGDIPSDFYVPTAFHQLKERPIVRQDERYLVPVPVLLDWAVKPILESALQGIPLWHRYESHRHDLTMNEAVRLLKIALPSSLTATELYYSVGGESLDGELDALISIDSALILLEVKAGVFTTPAKEGRAKRLERDLGVLVAKAHAQANRAYKYLKSAGEVLFRLRTGGELTLRQNDFPHIFLVSVLLEPLGHITTRLAASSLVSAQGHEHVLTISLYDLMVIAELAEPSPLILHYILRRVQALKQGLIEAHDELDLFGAYLDSGLFFRGDSFEQLDSLMVSTHTDMFDAYFMHKEGKRKRYVKKPEARMSTEFRRFITALNSSGLPNRLDAILQLLDMDEESRQRWMRGVLEVKRRFRRDKHVHSFTQMERDSGFGLVYFCGPEEEDDLGQIKRYMHHKVEQHGARGWLAIEDRERTPKYAFRRIVTEGDMVMHYRFPSPSTKSSPPELEKEIDLGS